MIFWKLIYSFNAQFLKGIIQASESASRQHLINPKKRRDPKWAYWFEEIMAKALAKGMFIAKHHLIESLNFEFHSNS